MNEKRRRSDATPFQSPYFGWLLLEPVIELVILLEEMLVMPLFEGWIPLGHVSIGHPLVSIVDPVLTLFPANPIREVVESDILDFCEAVMMWVYVVVFLELWLLFAVVVILVSVVIVLVSIVVKFLAAVAGFGFELVLAIAVAGFEVSAFVLDPELGAAA